METDKLWYIKIALCLLFLLLSFLLVHDNFPYYFIQALFSTFIEGKIPTVKITGHQYLNIFLFSFIKYVQHSMNLWLTIYTFAIFDVYQSLITDRCINQNLSSIDKRSKNKNAFQAAKVHHNDLRPNQFLFAQPYTYGTP